MSVTHIAAQCLWVNVPETLMRQLCAWCGQVLLEYNLARVAVPIGQDPVPASWPEGSLVRVDGHMSTTVDVVTDSDGTRLPDDACARNPLTLAALTS